MKRRMRDITILIVGMLLVGVPVMAVSYISSKDVSYKTDYNENVTNVEEALDILTNQVKEINNTGDSSSDDILSGKTAYVNGKLLTGSMANYGGATKSGSNITESGSNALIKIPAGYYNEDSSISVPLNTIEELPTINSNLNAKPSIFLKSYSGGNASKSYTFTESGRYIIFSQNVLISYSTDIVAILQESYVVNDSLRLQNYVYYVENARENVTKFTTSWSNFWSGFWILKL